MYNPSHANSDFPETGRAADGTAVSTPARTEEVEGAWTVLTVPFFHQQTPDTCAAACLRMAVAFRFPRNPVAESALAKRCGCIPTLGCLSGDVFLTAQRYTLPAAWLNDASIEQDIEDALGAGNPVLANVQLRALSYYLTGTFVPAAWHSILIVGLDSSAVYVHDPDTHGGPNRVADRAAFFLNWVQREYSAYRV